MANAHRGHHKRVHKDRTKRSKTPKPCKSTTTVPAINTGSPTSTASQAIAAGAGTEIVSATTGVNSDHAVTIRIRLKLIKLIRLKLN